ncbi:hypothetical protein [Streptomyces sp. NPDC002491]
MTPAFRTRSSGDAGVSGSGSVMSSTYSRLPEESRPRDLGRMRKELLSREDQRPDQHRQFAMEPFSLEDRYPMLLAVAFLQPYDHLAEDAAVRECADETSRRAFVRQRGRAEHGQNRTTGVAYRTRECARAQAQREHRRRKRQNASADPADRPHATTPHTAPDTSGKEAP